MSRSTAADRAEIDSRRVRRVYGALAGVYDRGFDWALGPGRRDAVRALPIREGERILEVGVGTGLSLPHYPDGCHISGIDISEPMLEQARDRAEGLPGRAIDLRLMDAHDLTYGDETFDHVLAPYVISVVPEPRRVMAEMARVCKVGGTVMVVNHFASSHRVMRAAERLMTPLSQWIGFRLDLPVATVTGTERLTLRSQQRVNMLGLWRMIEFRRI